MARLKIAPLAPDELEIHFTLGPASWPPEVLAGLLDVGASVCRLNLSHLSAEQLPAAVSHARDVASRAGRPLRIGVDLRGRKLRLGPLPGGGVTLEEGEEFGLIPTTPIDEGGPAPGGATVSYPGIDRALSIGDTVILADGRLALEVTEVRTGRVGCRVVRGGRLSERCGVSIPGRMVDLPALGPKDHVDLDALALLRPDLAYLSYVETADDIAALRCALDERGLRIPIVAKVERAVALSNIVEIGMAADAVCLARGDLGVEVPLPRLPEVQRQVIEALLPGARPTLLAGEVLASMVQRALPLRAEVTDVAVGVAQGFHGFILSDETAVGVDPVAAVRWLRDIARGGA